MAFVPPASQTVMHAGGCSRTLLQWAASPGSERKRSRSEEAQEDPVEEVPTNGTDEEAVSSSRHVHDVDCEEVLLDETEVCVISDDEAPPAPSTEGLVVPMTIRRIRKEQLESGGTPSAQPCSLDALNDEQRQVVRLVERGRSVFITGGAGTGKSFLLRALISTLDPRSCFVTASTGIAALSLGGTTVHSFAGVGLAKESAKELLERVRGSERSRNYWQACRVLVIDEISMLSGEFLDKLEYIARHIRRRNEPFGGIQLLLCGDFLQLAPVGDKRRGGGKAEPMFAFQSRAWRVCNPRVCLLKQVFRQANQTLVNVLNEMRMGEMSRDTLNLLTAHSSRTSLNFLLQSDGGDSVVDAHGNSMRNRFAGRSVIRSRNEDVDRINRYEFEKLSTESFVFVENVTGEAAHVKALQENSPVPPRLELRVGCRVMLCKNVDVSQGLVNGSIGTVTKFVNVELVDDFENPRAVEMCKLVSPVLKVLPVVRFPVRRFSRGTMREEVVDLDLIVEAQEWTVTAGTRQLAKRIHIPLRLAWAITVHKSQGMTLSSVNVDFDHMFAAGQAYVALSRCTSLEGMTLENFSQHAVITSAVAASYYRAVDVFSSGELEPDDMTITNPWGNEEPADDESGETSQDDEGSGGPGLNPLAGSNWSQLIESMRRRIATEVERDTPRAAPTAVEQNVRGVTRRRIIFDTCSLIYLVRIETVCLDDLMEANELFVPQIVLTELDFQVKNGQVPELQFSGRRVRNLLSDLLKDGKVSFQQPGEENLDVVAPTNLLRDNDGKILAYASYMQQKEACNPVCVCTEDKMLSLRCKSIGIPVCSFTIAGNLAH